MADEVTPTTEFVRELYVDATEGHREDDPDETERAAEFDRWLAERDAKRNKEMRAAYEQIAQLTEALRILAPHLDPMLPTHVLAVRDAETRRKALGAVSALHQPVVLYRHPDIEDDDAEWIRPIERLQELFEREAADEFSGVSGAWEEARLFVTERTYCGHCMKVVEEAVEPYTVPFSPLAQWPCATIRALAEGGENRG